MLKKLILIALAASIVFSLTNCRKKKDDDSPVVKGTVSDQSATSERDDAMEDVDDAINNFIGANKSARVEAYNLPCGVVRFDSTGTGAQKTYQLKYGEATPCGYKKKSGEVSFALVKGNSFGEMGAVYNVTFHDYEVIVLATNQTVKINGTQTVTNVDGGYFWQAVTEGKTIKHKLRGALAITFNNNTQRNRSYYQLRTWASSNGWAGLSFSADGDTTINNIKVSELGKTYEGNYDYQTQIMIPLKWENCGTSFAGPYVLKTGKGRTSVTVPNLSPAYVEAEAGYQVSISSLTTGTKVNNCNSNAYQIHSVFGTLERTEYQLY